MPDALTFILLFIIYFIFDVLYVKYIMYVNKLRPVAAANMSVMLLLISSYGVVSYMQNIYYLASILIGAWLGCYFMVKYDSKR